MPSRDVFVKNGFCYFEISPAEARFCFSAAILYLKSYVSREERRFVKLYKREGENYDGID